MPATKAPDHPPVTDTKLARNTAGRADPVLSALGNAELAYLGLRDEIDRLKAELEHAEGERDAARTAAAEARQLRDDLAREREQAARNEERARILADCLHGLHESLFDGNVYTMILKACMAITGATRGLYVTAWEENLRIHAAVDVDGYPDGLAADAITVASRVICVADAYSAMISKRSYKESMTEAEAREELIRCQGTHFDPAVVDAFVAVLDEPEAADDAPDAFGLASAFYHPLELRHALERTAGG